MRIMIVDDGFVVVKISSFDFLTLRLSLLAASHSAILDSSAFRILAPSALFLCEKNKLVSSAKSVNLQSFEESTMSFM